MSDGGCDNGNRRRSTPQIDTFGLRRLAAALEREPSHVGPYEVVRPLGGGGMGRVYLCREAGGLPREVAVKLMNLGLDRREAVLRFAHERHALARLGHENVARVLAADATAEGRPYVVMEYLPGPTLGRYCDEKRLTVRRRLGLFAGVCRGVQHAHARGVFHRDLKPDNVVVVEQDGRPAAKVIDFGIAHVAEAAAGNGHARGNGERDSGRLTVSEQRFGTPGYVSPEQAQSGVAGADARSDVYSLGAMLYELLCGALPQRDHFSARGGETTPPSRRLRGMAAAEAAEAVRRRGSDLAALARLLGGDLGWVPMRAMAADPDERYQSAAELCADVERWLAGKPLRAAPPSRAYRLRKFLWRRRKYAAAAAVFALLVAGGLSALAVQVGRTDRARRAAERAEAVAGRRAEVAVRERERGNQVIGVLRDAFVAAEPGRKMGADTTLLREVADAVRRRATDDASLHPLTRASLLEQSAHLRGSLGDNDGAVADAGRAVEVMKAYKEDEPVLWWKARAALADARFKAGAAGPGVEEQRRLVDAMAREPRRFGDELPPERLELASLCELAGDHAAALRIARDVRDDAEANLAPDDPFLTRARNVLVKSMWVPNGGTSDQPLRDEARALARSASESADAALGPLAPESIIALDNRVVVEADPEAQLGLEDELYRRYERACPPGSPRLIAESSKRALLLSGLGRYAEAEPAARAAAAGLEQVLGAEAPMTLAMKMVVARVLIPQGKGAEALPFARDVYAAASKTQPPDSPMAQISLTVLLEAAIAAEDVAGLDGPAAGLLERRVASHSEDDFRTRQAASLLMQVRRAAGEDVAADALRARFRLTPEGEFAEPDGGATTSPAPSP